MERSAVVDWLSAYVRAWQSYDPTAIGALFSENATYSFHPFDEPRVGREAIVAAWLEDRDAPGTYEARYEPIAIDGDAAVANGRSLYFKDAARTELHREYDNIFVVEFDNDGRCRSFREWYVGRRGQAEPAP